jgi:hypothetical protein
MKDLNKTSYYIIIARPAQFLACRARHQVKNSFPIKSQQQDQK